MLSGRDAFSKLQSALTSVRKEEGQLTAALNNATQEVTRLRAKETASYRSLALLRLDAISKNEITDRLSSAEQRALKVIEERRAATQQQTAERERLTTLIAELEKTHAEKLAAVEAAAEAIDKQREATQQRIAGDTRWKELTQAAKEAAIQAARANTKAERSANEKHEKGKPYEDDPLFMYLWKRGYGTSEYKAGNIARWLDGKVARLIGYEELRQNYYMLNEIPTRLKDHAERLKDSAKLAANPLAEFERAALESDGIQAIETKLSSAEDAENAVEAKVKEAESSLRALTEETANQTQQGSDPQLQPVLEEMSRALAREDLQALYNQAEKTETPEDEKIVSEIERLKNDIADAEAKTEEVRQTILDAQRKREELEYSRDRFQRQGYNEPFGQFSNSDVIGQVIGGILAGAMRGRDLDRTLDDGFQRRQPRTRGSFGGGIRTADGDPWSRSERMGGSWADNLGSSGDVWPDSPGGTGDYWDDSGSILSGDFGDDDFRSGGGF